MLTNFHIYKIEESYLETRGELLKQTLKKWLKENNTDATVDILILGNKYGDLIIDYESDIKNSQKIKMLVEQILTRFNIEIKYENQIDDFDF